MHTQDTSHAGMTETIGIQTEIMGLISQALAGLAPILEQGEKEASGRRRKYNSVVLLSINSLR